MDELGDLEFGKKSKYKRKSTNRAQQEEYSVYLSMPTKPKPKIKSKENKVEKTKVKSKTAKPKAHPAKPEVYSDKQIDEMLEEFKGKKFSFKKAMKETDKKVANGFVDEIDIQNLINNDRHLVGSSAEVGASATSSAGVAGSLGKRKHEVEEIMDESDVAVEAKHKKKKRVTKYFDDDLLDYSDLADIEVPTPAEEQLSGRYIVLRITGLPSHTKRHHIRRCMQYYRANTVFIEYKDGEDTVHVRMQNQGHAKQVLHRIRWNNAEFIVAGASCDASLLTEEEEKTYLEQVKMKQQEWKQQHLTEDGRPTDKLLQKMVMKKEAKEINKASREDEFNQSGIVLLLSNLPKTTSLYSLAEKLSTVAPGKVAHVDYTAGEGHAHIRCKLPDYVPHVLRGLSGYSIEGCAVSVEQLDEATEQQYLSATRNSQLSRAGMNLSRRGTVLLLTQLPAHVTSDVIRDTVQLFTTASVYVDHVEYTDGESTAYVHTHHKNTAKKLLFNMVRITGVQGFRLQGATCRAELVRGEEERRLLLLWREERIHAVEDMYRGVHNAVLHITGISKRCVEQDISSTLSWLDIDYTHLQFSIRDQEAWVQLKLNNSADKVISSLPSKIKISNSLVSITALTPQQERRYLRAAVRAVQIQLGDPCSAEDTGLDAAELRVYLDTALQLFQDRQRRVQEQREQINTIVTKRIQQHA